MLMKKKRKLGREPCCLVFLSKNCAGGLGTSACLELKEDGLQGITKKIGRSWDSATH